jgi:hypothetical protein
MKEPDDEGLANHIGPESCADVRKGGSEALTGGHVGWVVSREILEVQGADGVKKHGRPYCVRRHRKSSADPARSKTPRTRGRISSGNREIPVVALGDQGRIAKSKDARQ